MRLIALTVSARAALGLLVAFAIRSRVPRLRWTAPLAVLDRLGIGVAMVVLIPPRGEISDPQYYAHGPDIPRALEAVEAARRTSGVLDQELDAQLVGLARLVVDPGRRQCLDDRPVITVASDLHNNTVGVDLLERPADGGPVFFLGDLTDRGSPFETRLVRRAAHTGKPFVFVSGNHDSDFLAASSRARARSCSRATGGWTGRHAPAGHQPINGPAGRGLRRPVRAPHGRVLRRPLRRPPDPVEQDKFLGWLQPLIGKVDVVMVHEPALIETALRGPEGRPAGAPARLPRRPHAQGRPGHAAGRDRDQRREHGRGRHGQPDREHEDRVARFVYTLEPAFQPLAADLVSIDPGTGSSSARREILGDPRAISRVAPLWTSCWSWIAARVWHPYGPMPAATPPLPVVSASGVRLSWPTGAS